VVCGCRGRDDNKKDQAKLSNDTNGGFQGNPKETMWSMRDLSPHRKYDCRRKKKYFLFGRTEPKRMERRTSGQGKGAAIG